MTPEVATAISELEAAMPASTVTAFPDSEGGAHVIVDPVSPGPAFAQDETWIGFHITFHYPAADCYPHFVRADLTRRDGAPLGTAISMGTFGLDGRAAVQISRATRRLNPAVDTAALKLEKVLLWLHQQ